MNNPLDIQFQEIGKIDAVDAIKETSFPGILTINRPVFDDERGDFWEVARIPDIEKVLHRTFKVAQINRSRNIQKGTLRGIHVATWDKLLFVDRGAAFIALVDLRKNSPTYRQIFTETIGDGFKTMAILVPAGFGNSYQALSDNTDYMYAVTDMWSPGSEVGIAWNDPTLGIEWPIVPPILSPKDKLNKLLEVLLKSN